MHYLLVAGGSFLIYAAILVLYRLRFSPLAKFPGPKIAAATTLYQFYYDMVRGGQYVWTVEEMHRTYGPIVRIRPDALHVNDPNFVDTLYSQSPKHRRERYRTVLQMLQAPGSILATKDHDLHRKRRSILNPYFSHRNVRRLEPIVNSTLADLLHRMQGWAGHGGPANMNRAFRAATKDVIQAYALGDGEKCLEMRDCNSDFFDVMTPQRVIHLGTHVYWLATLMANLPPAIMTKLIPRIGVFIYFMENLMLQIEEIRKAKELPEGKTIFHDIMRSNTIPESEKATQRLADEAMVILIAGSETTASTLAAIVYHLLADRELLDRLKAELESVMPDPSELPVAAKLDTLPLLNAIIEEALRLYPGATHRQDRTAPDEDLTYRSPSGEVFLIPAGTAIGMTAPILNRHPDLYANRNEFIPERYIKDPSLSKHLFSFSKGTRQCIGMNLAYQELQTFTAGIFRKYGLYDPSKDQGSPTLELYHTTQRDIAMDADYITPKQYDGSQGLRLIIRH